MPRLCTSFELSFGDKVLLLDNYYDRSPRDRSLGFGAADVTRADLILIGHPHATFKLYRLQTRPLTPEIGQRRLARAARTQDGRLRGVAVTWLGLGLSYFTDYPVGFLVTSLGFAAYVLALAWRRLR